MNLRRHPRLRRHVLAVLGTYWLAYDRHIQPFVFIHINKTGGQSIGKALRTHYEHKTARRKRRELGDEYWNSKFKFSFVRNPWDKIVSEYHYRVKTNQNGLGDSPLPFDVWVRRVFVEKDPVYRDTELMFQPQFEWLRDEGGNLAVDFVGRFEHLAEDFQKVCHRIGRRATLPHVNRSEHRPYTDLYDGPTRDVIAEVFSPDVRAFGYEFDRPIKPEEIISPPNPAA